MKDFFSIDSQENEFLANLLNVDIFDAAKTNQAIFWFLKKCEENNFISYKTHLLKFFSFCELLYTQKFSNHFTSLEFLALENGPIPNNIDTYIKNVLNGEEFKRENVPFTPISQGNKNINLKLNKYFLETDMFFSPKDLEIMNESLNHILELKKTEKISEYLHEHSKSWQFYRDIANSKKIPSIEMQFDKDLDLKQDDINEILSLYKAR